MKYLRKINKGFALTLIVLLILAIYIISIEVSRNADKPAIESAVRDYIEFINKCAVLSENDQKLYNIIDLTEEQRKQIEAGKKSAVTAQVLKFESGAKEQIIDNNLAVKMQKERFEEFLESDNEPTNSFVTKFNKEITKFKKFAFDADQVTVTFNSKVNKEIKYLEEDDELSRKVDFSSPEETMTLQKINGAWKVVYADLQYQDYSTVTNMMVY
ncbi:MAG: DUF4301 family protein [Clostridia bacterium]|nr:DUF4301 family protein [Clostridia bacterium]